MIHRALQIDVRIKWADQHHMHAKRKEFAYFLLAAFRVS